MPIYNAPLLAIDAKETRRYAGLMKAEDFPEEKIKEAVEEGQLLAAPKGIWEEYSYDAKTQTVLADTPVTLTGKSIGKHLKDCERVIMLAATVGEDIEAAVTENFAAGNYAFSVLLDAAATTAVEQVADGMEKAIARTAHKEGYEMRWRFSAGYGDLPLTLQPEMLRLAHGEKIGITLTESLMLHPRKSITAIIGLSRKQNNCPAEDKAKSGCAACDKIDCPSRKA